MVARGPLCDKKNTLFPKPPIYRSPKGQNGALDILKSKGKKSLSAKLNFISVYRELLSLERDSYILLKWGITVLVLNCFLIKGFPASAFGQITKSSN